MGMQSFNVQKVENGYVLGVVFNVPVKDDNGNIVSVNHEQEVHIAANDAKLKKLIKQVIDVKE